MASENPAYGKAHGCARVRAAKLYGACHEGHNQRLACAFGAVLPGLGLQATSGPSLVVGRRCSRYETQEPAGRADMYVHTSYADVRISVYMACIVGGYTNSGTT